MTDNADTRWKHKQEQNETPPVVVLSICKTGAIGRRGRLKPVIVTVRIRGLVFVLAGELEILLNVSHENPDDE